MEKTELPLSLKISTNFWPIIGKFICLKKIGLFFSSKSKQCKGSNILSSLLLYRRETEFFTVFREEQGMVPRHIFEEFIAFAHDSDLEDVLTLQTKLYRCAHIFLGIIE